MKEEAEDAGSIGTSLVRDDIVRLSRQPGASKQLDLRHACMAGIDLSYCDLRGALLAGADLGGSQLDGVNLSGASMAGVNMAGANLPAARLVSADLRGSDLPGSNLTRADLRSADLRRADLQNCYMPGACLSETNLQGADLQGARLPGANIRGADLRGARLRWADLEGADISGADLTGADLREADLPGAIAARAVLCWADISGANLTSSRFEGADLREVDLRGARLNGARFHQADLTDARLDRAILDGADFKGARIGREQLALLLAAGALGLSDAEIVESPESPVGLPGSVLRLRLGEHQLAAPRLAQMLTACTDLYTKIWLLSRGRLADMVAFAQHRTPQLAYEANLIVHEIRPSAPPEIRLGVAPEIGQSLRETIAAIAVGRRNDVHSAAMPIGTDEYNRVVDETVATEILHPEPDGSGHELGRERAALELERQRVVIERQRLRAQREAYRLRVMRLDLATESAARTVDLFQPNVSPTERSLLIQLLVPTMLQLGESVPVEFE